MKLNVFWLLIISILMILENGNTQTSKNSNFKLLSTDLSIFVSNNVDEYSQTKAEALRTDLQGQADAIGTGNLDVVLAHDSNIPYGYWTFVRLFPYLRRELPGKKWYFFCEQSTKIDLDKLLYVLSQFDHKEEYFLGHALWDTQAVITHHFAFIHNPSQFKYPDFDSGWAISSSLMKKLVNRLGVRPQMEFSIDPKHEVAMFIYEDNKGTNLTNVSEFCTHKSLDKTNCASTVQLVEPHCGKANKDKILVAVKTCEKFHLNRVPIIRQTVGKLTANIIYYSDTNDETIPTVHVGVENTERGHCQKLYNIIKSNQNRKEMNWLVVIDDDTIMNFNRLRRELACYDPSKPLLMGERYGYGVNSGNGYEYITGGGGMILSREAIRRLVSSDCRCHSIDSPDDMWLGQCFKQMDIQQIDLKSLHQARPIAYSPDFLKHRYLVSFHKHYDINPMHVYNKYLGGGREDAVWSNEETKRDEL